MRKLLFSMMLTLAVGTNFSVASDASGVREESVQIIQDFVESVRSDKEMRKLLRKSIRNRDGSSRAELEEYVQNYFDMQRNVLQSKKLEFSFDSGTYTSYSILYINEWGGDSGQQQYMQSRFNRNRIGASGRTIGPGLGASAGYAVQVCVANTSGGKLYGVRGSAVIGFGFSSEISAGPGGACAVISAAVGVEAQIGVFDWKVPKLRVR